jgi:membrane-bound lytic murein transglycosylase B
MPEQQKQLELQVVEKAARKARRGIDELLALEKIEKTTLVSTAALAGSYAGAFGIPQFLPSSYVRWAVDGNSDGVIDLFTVGCCF